MVFHPAPIEPVLRRTALRCRGLGLTVYTVEEAVRGIAPPTEWERPELHDWVAGLIGRMHRRFVALLTVDQRRAIADLAERPLDELYSFYFDPQVWYRPERYRPDPDRNAMAYYRRLYGVPAAKELCAQVKEMTRNDPNESICYLIGDRIRYLMAIW